MITDSIAGLIAGLGLGVGIVVVGAVLTDRLRRRDEIAIAIGAPVELSVGRFRCPRFFRKWRLRRRMHNPTGDMEMIERRIRAHLEAAPASALAVISIECAAMASVVMAALALSLGQEGKNVVVTDLADGRPVQALLDRQRSPRHLERRRLPRGEGRRLSRRERRQLNRAPYPGYPELTSRSRLQSTRPSRPIITPDAMRAPLGSWEGWNLGPERPSQGNYWGSVHVNNPHSRAKWSTWQQVPLPQQEEVPVAEPSPDLPVPVQPGSVTVVSGPDDPIQTSVHRSNENVDSVLAFATLDPAFGAAHIASWATEAVVVVGAGKARADQVVAAGQMLRHAGIRARAAFVVGAESDDRSYGLPLQTDHLGR
jgi:hypothetical protein